MHSSLKHLVSLSLVDAGCPVETVQENLLKAVLPPDSELNTVFEVDGLVYLALVEFEAQVLAGLEPVRHLLPGSYFLHRFLSYLTQHGQVATVELPERVPLPPDHELLRHIEGVFQGWNAKQIFRDSASCKRHHCLTFHFHIDLLACEICRHVVSVTFDLPAGRLMPTLTMEGPWEGNDSSVKIDEKEIELAYGNALEEVRRTAREAVERYSQDHREEREDASRELRRNLASDLEEFDAQLQRLPQGEPQREDLLERRSETEREWLLRLAQVKSQYEAEGAVVTLIAATRQIRPVWQLEARLVAAGGATVSLDWGFDANAGFLLAPVCSMCGRMAAEMYLGDQSCRHPLCPDCQAGPFTCEHPHCKTCSKPCDICEREVCPDCLTECLDCGNLVCNMDRHRCISCQRFLCGECSEICWACESVAALTTVYEFLSSLVSNCEVCGGYRNYLHQEIQGIWDLYGGFNETDHGSLVEQWVTNPANPIGLAWLGEIILTCSAEHQSDLLFEEELDACSCRCGSCGNTVPDQEIVRCVLCGDVTCTFHSFRCDSCDETFCLGHADELGPTGIEDGEGEESRICRDCRSARIPGFVGAPWPRCLLCGTVVDFSAAYCDDCKVRLDPPSVHVRRPLYQSRYIASVDFCADCGVQLDARSFASCENCGRSYCFEHLISEEVDTEHTEWLCLPCKGYPVPSGSLVGELRLDEDLPVHFLRAVEEGNVEVVRHLIEMGAPLDYAWDLISYDPMGVAIRKGDLEIVRLLLQSGAEIFEGGNEIVSHLEAALRDGIREIAELLLEYGADVEGLSHEGVYVRDSLLTKAAAEGNMQAAELLLRYGADVDGAEILVDPSDSWNQEWRRQQLRPTPLTIVAAAGHAPMVELLLLYGADPDGLWGDRFAPMIEYGINIDTLLSDCFTPLTAAVKNGHLEIVGILLKHEASANLPGSQNSLFDKVSPLHLAVGKGRLEMVELLLRQGANVDPYAGDHEDRNAPPSPLMIALRRRHFKIAQLLIEHNASVDCRDAQGCTPLIIATKKPNLGMMGLLLTKDATDINAVDKDGVTALLLAVRMRHLGAVKLLLENGADVNACNREGETVQEVAWNLMKASNLKANVRRTAEKIGKLISSWREDES